MNKKILRKIPSVDVLIHSDEVKQWIEKYNRETVVNAIRYVLNELRSEILNQKKFASEEKNLSVENIIKRAQSLLEKKFSPSLKKAINATGIILHTGLGRSVLSQEAREAINSIIEGYCNLAIEAETGRRGQRDSHLSALLCELSGAQAATIVNNNAAATLLILNTLAKGKEVIVSRGQLVEIGGSFRMPEVMEASGAILKEVGTTNKTHLKDYSSAISETTGAIMHVHHSNYRILGFAEEPSIEELVELGKKHKLPVIDDLGSGALVDLKEFGLETEPMVQRSIKAGADVACFSGDKLIGGPQSGVIVGKKEIIEKIKKNPLARAFRVGKITIAAMEATLKLFLNPSQLADHHPLYRMLSAKLEELEKRAQGMAKKLKDQRREEARFQVVNGDSQVGSGSAPIETVPTKLLSIKPLVLSAANLARKLRYHNPPVFARVQKEKVLLDFRTIQPDEDSTVCKALLSHLREKELNHD
jgi:L-seryl-tRNA(Ser) seleniumtransferase